MRGYYIWKDFAKYQMFGDKKEYMKQTFRGGALQVESS
jgi:hypothetical protein